MSVRLDVENLFMRFGGIVAVESVSFSVEPQEILAVIGPNGAGKTTVFNCVSGFYRPCGGEIRLGDIPIQGMPSHQIARRGVVRTFQNVRLFANMTVVENLLVAMHQQLDRRLWAGLTLTRHYRKTNEEAIAKAAYWLETMGLRTVANREAGTLSYGQQRRLEIARCMITGPKILMLDEPAAGLNPRETGELDELIVRLREAYKVSIVLIEHDMRLVMGLSDRIVVLDQGRVIATGRPEAVRHDPVVLKAYLGDA
jgi:branched-chain amino acid transport system ATP-binding protein